MEELLLAALLIGWAAVLLPSALRSRRSLDPSVTVGGFAEAMAVLRGRPQGREIMVPAEPDRIVGYDRGPTRGSGAVGRPSARQALMVRRKAMLTRLLTMCGVTVVSAVVFGGLFWPVCLATVGITGGYVALLRHYKVEHDAAREVVRQMDWTRRHGAATVAPEMWVGADLAADGPAPHGWQPVAVGAEEFGGLQVATSPDQPWEPQASVRIRRWET